MDEVKREAVRFTSIRRIQRESYRSGMIAGLIIGMLLGVACDVIEHHLG